MTRLFRGTATRTLLLLALSVAAGPLLRAQSDTALSPANAVVPPSFYFGAYGGFASTSHTANLSATYFNSRITLPAGADFTDGSGSGPLGGLFFELPFSHAFAIGARVGYQDRGGTFTKAYTNTKDVMAPDGSAVTANVTGNLVSTFGYLSLTPHIKLSPSSLPLYLVAGPTFLYPLSATQSYTEAVTSPATGVFRDSKRRARTIASGDLTRAGLAPALTVGVGYDLMFSPTFGVFVEGDYIPTLSDVVTGLASGQSWANSSFAGIVGIRFGAGGSTPEPPPIAVVVKEKVEPKRDSVVAKGVTPQGLRDTIIITSHNVKAMEVHALLPYIFFPRDSADVPARYVRLGKTDYKTWQPERLPGGNTMDIYHQVINIIGARMRDNKKAKLTITGCLSQYEHGDTVLSKRRAQAVAKYLTDVWRIKANRMEVVGRVLPANPSLSGTDSLEGSRENQRVEIASDDYSILAPVRLPDTAYLAPAGIIRFTMPTTASPGPPDSWSMNIKIGDSLVEDAVTGYGPPPHDLDFRIMNRPGLNLSRPMPVTATMILRDTNYKQIGDYKSNPVYMYRVGEDHEVHAVVGGKLVDTYNLLLYSFNSDAILDFTQQATTIMASKITPKSTVRVIGHTDRIGQPSYNQKLSEKRAQVAAQNLQGVQNLGAKIEDVSGIGERNLLYDNTLPEGRYYCRTVTVTIETPAEPGEVSER